MDTNTMNQRLVWNFEWSDSTPHVHTYPPHPPEEVKWEARFFWHENEIISLIPINHALFDLANYRQKHKEDYYYLLPQEKYNIKRRRNELVYKPLLQTTHHASGFGAKINLESEVLAPKLERANHVDAATILQQIKQSSTEVFVKKEAFVFKFPTSPLIKLELGRLQVRNQIYFSACIEGKSLYLVELISEHLLGKFTSCDYVTFLNNIIK